MKNKIMILTIAGMLTIGGISVAYANGRTDVSFNGFNRTMMGTQNSGSNSSYNYMGAMMGAQYPGFQSKDNFNAMINIMKNNGFKDQATAMENRDFDSMQKFMANISDEDYKKMIDIMSENGYGFMANMMQNVGKQDMKIMHKSMMGR